METDLECDSDRDRFAILAGGTEAPLLDRIERASIDVFVEAANHTQIFRQTLGGDDQLDADDAFNADSARAWGRGRSDLVNDARRRDAIAKIEDLFIGSGLVVSKGRGAAQEADKSECNNPQTSGGSHPRLAVQTREVGRRLRADRIRKRVNTNTAYGFPFRALRVPS